MLSTILNTLHALTYAILTTTQARVVPLTPFLQMKKSRHRDLSNSHKVTQLASRRQQYKVLLYSLLFYFSQQLIKCHYPNYQIYNLKLRETGG